MLFSSTTDFYSNVSSVATETLGGVYQYVVLIIGIIFGFYIINMIMDIIENRKLQATQDKWDSDTREFKRRSKAIEHYRETEIGMGMSPYDKIPDDL